ncbi:exocyst complex component EXO70H1-like [Populus alba x Populus x berolinensis]|uniref:Exocyst subunit Exo70 family protein n=1 Tax=Populus alba x Populus x berolinensis TaxID=444605 RepID=A0AAD6QAS8_9ROSI|nr:exocyst complex component EXO70H1-like [Populus alba x Populus x berolinensis]
MFSESVMEETIKNVESIITKWDPNSSPITRATSLFHSNREEAEDFLESVNDLRRAMHALVSEHSTSDKLLLAQNLMQIAMARLEKEFYQILSAARDQKDPESISARSSEGSSNLEDENELGSEDLKSIADCMISSGYSMECIKIYKLIRKSIVDEGLYLLGIEEFRPSQILKMNWEALEHQIKNWLNAVKIAAKTLFIGEKALCDHVFSASQTIRESCFSEITIGGLNLFRFPELVAKCKKLPERIFPLLELYEALSDIRPDVELIFDSESTSKIRQQAVSSLHGLGESIRAILSDFESTIQKDSSKALIVGGGIHPLTQKVTSYISSLADYSRILSDIVADSSPPYESPNYDASSTPAVSVHLAWLILVLLCKLDRKAEGYKDMSLSYLFLANNLQFVIDKVCTTRLYVLLGEDWVFKHAEKVIQYASTYETLAWGNVFSSLPENNSPLLSPEAAKECFQRFNAAFEEAYKKQASWVVPDRRLRDELKVSIAKELIPAYREFYDKHKVMLSRVRFGPDDLGNYLSDLFHGTAISGSTSPPTPR